MIKTFIYIAVLLVLTIIPSKSQEPLSYHGRDIRKYKVVDESNLRITYSLDFKYSDKDKKHHNDIRTVLVGKKISKDFSAIMNMHDSIYTSLVKQGAKSAQNLPNSIYPIEIFNNYENGKCLITYRTFMNGPALRYFDNQPILKWELKEGAQTILGYKCQSATTKFAGRDYIAWFTTELPINAGPYKFSGLPGLILKVEEINGFFVWTAIGISNIKESIVKHDIEYQKCTKKQAEETIKKMFASPETFNGMEWYVQQKDGKWRKATSEDEIPIPYQPLEK